MEKPADLEETGPWVNTSTEFEKLKEIKPIHIELTKVVGRRDKFLGT